MFNWKAEILIQNPRGGERDIVAMCPHRLKLQAFLKKKDWNLHDKWAKYDRTVKKPLTAWVAFSPFTYVNCRCPAATAPFWQAQWEKWSDLSHSRDLSFLWLAREKANWRDEIVSRGDNEKRTYVNCGKCGWRRLPLVSIRKIRIFNSKTRIQFICRKYYNQHNKREKPITGD